VTEKHNGNGPLKDSVHLHQLSNISILSSSLLNVMMKASRNYKCGKRSTYKCTLYAIQYLLLLYCTTT